MTHHSALDENDLAGRLAQLSLEQKVQLLTGADTWALHGIAGIGLRPVVTSDGPAGVRGVVRDERDTSLNIPSATALSASWDVALVERVGSLLAVEARRKHVDVLLAPTVNLHRSPYGGRHFECFSEDPLLTADIGLAYVEGVQSGGVAATVKHFVANDSETERFTLDAHVDERSLRELYLAPFELLCRHGAWAVMAAYNGVNGHTMTESPLLRDILIEEWGWDGVVMSDWTAARSTVPTAEAALDLVMPGPDGPWGDALVAAVRSGEVAEARIDEKVLRLLRLAARVGALDGGPAPLTPASLSHDEQVELLRESAAAGFVLARNQDDLLPLTAAELRSVAVIGPNAAVARTLGGGSATVYPAYTVSPLDGIVAALPGAQVTHALGTRTITRISAAAPPLCRTPEGAPGLLVRVLDEEGNEIGREQRGTGRLQFWSGAAGVPRSEMAQVELTTVVTARTSGPHLLGFDGPGDAALFLDGVEILAAVLELRPGSDPAEILVRPPSAEVEVPLVAGQSYDLRLRMRPDADSDLSALGLNVQEPSLSEAELLAEAVAAAAAADVAVVVVGTTEEVESEGFDRDDLNLPGAQDALVRAVVAANPRTVVVVNSGSPVLLPWLTDVPALLISWFPGQEAGTALAEVLLGRREPRGRLPTTWPLDTHAPLPSVRPHEGALHYDEGIFVGYRRFDREGVEPALPFGHGLGWSAWSYEALEAPTRVVEGEDLTLTVQLINLGTRAATEVVQAYLSRPESAVDRPVRWLAGFATVSAEPGGTTSVEIRLRARALQHWDTATHAWATEPGSYVLELGRSSRDLRLSHVVEVHALAH